MIVRTSAITRAALGVVACLATTALGPLARPLQAQQGGEEEEEARRAAAIARADAIRDTLTQPPGHRGPTAQDVARIPFRLLGGAATAAALPPLLLYRLAEKVHLVDRVQDIDAGLKAADVHVRPDLIGSRSWPALVARWDGLDPLFLEGGVSLRGYTLVRGGLDVGDTLRGAELVGTHHRLTKLHTWGPGMDAPYEGRTDYALTRRSVLAGAWTPVAPHLRLGVDGGWEEDDVGRGRDDFRDDLQDAPYAPDYYGVAEPATYWRGGAGVDLDWTRIQAMQVVGFRALGRWDLFRGAGDTDSDFQRATGDVRLYVPTTGRHSIAVRGLAEDVFDEGGDGVPFHRLAVLGDDDGLRGYSSNRFRDRALLAVMAEWRYEVWFHPGDEMWRVEGFAFVDHGGVGPTLGDVDHFETTPGLGLRFVTGEAVLFEVYAAFNGDKSPRFDIELFQRTF